MMLVMQDRELAPECNDRQSQVAAATDQRRNAAQDGKKDSEHGAAVWHASG